MKINIQSPGLAPNQELEKFVKEEVERFFHLHKDIISSEVCLSLDSSFTAYNKHCRMRLLIPGNDLLATAKCRTFEEAIVQCAEALERQIEKRKTKTAIRKPYLE
ncbi:MAG: HPF/RaiA family ribosome-associated protein [Ferruginibacter sp.]